MEHSYIGNTYVNALESLILSNPQSVVWGGDYADNDKGYKSNVYMRCHDKLKVTPPSDVGSIKSANFVVNHTKKTFVDKSKTPKDNWGMRIHPLPLLTVEGNGRGGGDYFSDTLDANPTENEKLIGTWARDVISVEFKAPKGYKELKFGLVEEEEA